MPAHVRPLATAADFESWQRTYHAKLVALAQRYVGVELAPDVVQDAWLNAWRHRASYRGDAAPNSWLYRIVQNTACSVLRQQQRRPVIAGTWEDALKRPTRAPSPEQVLVAHAQRDYIRAAVQQLTAAEQRAIRAVDFRDETGKVAAARQGVCHSTLKTRVHRGRAKLRRWLQDVA